MGKATPRFAEDANYFDTTVHPAKSLGEIQEMLDDFGAENVMVIQGQAGGKTAWMIRFMWLDKPYRFLFTPLDCRNPDNQKTVGGKKLTNTERAKYQMGRIAVHFVKAILTAAEAHPHSLFGFMELSVGQSNGQLPPTAGELNVEGLAKALPTMSLPLLIQGELP
jgi:uncharacterized protein YwbE